MLHALAYNLTTFMRCIELPEAMADWSLGSRLIDFQSQKMTVAASATAERKVVAHLS